MEDLADLHWRSVPIYRSERLAGRDPLDLAIDLLLLQGALPTDELDRLFTRSESDVLIRAGLRFDFGTAARSGEGIQKRIVAGLPPHLAPGGIAQVVTELGERDDDPLVHRSREWLNGARWTSISFAWANTPL